MDEEYDPRQDPDYDWDDPEVTDEKLAALKMERTVMGVDFEQQTRQLLQEAAPSAALTIIGLARAGSSDNIKFNASKYIIDMLRDKEDGEGGLLEEVVNGLVKDAEKLANGRAL